MYIIVYNTMTLPQVIWFVLYIYLTRYHVLGTDTVDFTSGRYTQLSLDVNQTKFVDILRYHNDEDAPRYCRYDLCLNTTSFNYTKGNLQWPDTRVGMRSYVRCRYAYDDVIYASRDCLPLNEIDVAWAAANLSECPGPPLKTLLDKFRLIDQDDQLFMFPLSEWEDIISDIYDVIKKHPDDPTFSEDMSVLLKLLQSYERQTHFLSGCVLADSLEKIFVISDFAFQNFYMDYADKKRLLDVLTSSASRIPPTTILPMPTKTFRLDLLVVDQYHVNTEPLCNVTIMDNSTNENCMENIELELLIPGVELKTIVFFELTNTAQLFQLQREVIVNLPPPEPPRIFQVPPQPIFRHITMPPPNHPPKLFPNTSPTTAFKSPSAAMPTDGDPTSPHSAAMPIDRDPTAPSSAMPTDRDPTSPPSAAMPIDRDPTAPISAIPTEGDTTSPPIPAMSTDRDTTSKEADKFFWTSSVISHTFWRNLSSPFPLPSRISPSQTPSFDHIDSNSTDTPPSTFNSSTVATRWSNLGSMFSSESKNSSVTMLPEASSRRPTLLEGEMTQLLTLPHEQSYPSGGNVPPNPMFPQPQIMPPRPPIFFNLKFEPHGKLVYVNINTRELQVSSVVKEVILSFEVPKFITPKTSFRAHCGNIADTRYFIDGDTMMQTDSCLAYVPREGIVECTCLANTGFFGVFIAPEFEGGRQQVEAMPYPPDAPPVGGGGLGEIMGFAFNYEIYVLGHVLRALSLLGLLLTLASFVFFSKLRRGDTTYIMLHLSIALVLMIVVLYIVEGIAYSKVGCRASNVMRYYVILLTLLWNVVEAVNMYIMLVKVFDRQISRFTTKAALFAWGLPLLPIIILLAINVKSFDGYFIECKFRCLYKPPILYYALLVPIGVIMLFNLIVFGVVFSVIVKHARSHQGGKRKKWLSRLVGALALLVLLGVPWIFSGFGAIDASNNKDLSILEGVFHAIFTILVNSQGIFIFLFHCVRNSKVRSEWRSTLLRSTTTASQVSSSNNRRQSNQKTLTIDSSVNTTAKLDTQTSQL